MKKLQFKKDINSSAKNVYETMLGLKNIKTYEQWTSEFNPTSTYEGTWEKGAKMYFIGTDEHGNRGGMISEIADIIPSKFVSIRHYGMLDGVNEITQGAQVEKWAGGLENYTFRESNGVTTVTVDMDTTEEYMDYFKTTWPKALDKLKIMAEK
ncbi:tungsten formylmethanofuran dehydrogenase [Confluentibacter citreus]|uniref:tungsten formylmethanofuran dehydrogenase n=1 Tax=Confluentibacter citreus TaxID=2007307 RepID=UPI000C289CEF|nr:tungsten formylmethanofuran dehydrogenase [Confluentibacter citreus]